MESAIPQHLRAERSQPTRMREDWNPPSPAFSARFPETIESVVMAYYGLQYQGERPASARDAANELRRQIGEVDGPVHHDVAVAIDPAGFTNEITALYWTDAESYRRWSEQTLAWTDPQHEHGSVGRFVEIATPGVRDFETIFGGRRMEGVSVASDGIGGEIAEHGYWGSMRDRLPSAQTADLEPDGRLRFEQDGDLVVVHPHDGMTLIRSGQDWRGTEGEARDWWASDIRPVLQEGMEFLTAQGNQIGCYSNRLMQIIDDGGALVEKTYGHGWWHSLRELEDWSRSHKTHLKIFGAFGQFVKHFRSAAGLRLYHEVSVLDADQLRFEYLGCHERTGLLAARS
ncbi:phenylacetaldoxime dehydratase family protein [Blastococcus sp. Marseille-P5729]|uniref:phenylacetaldoxime dehydratase family protein n=1 Tax=Blastococcus sp. Marseille-P5729 TaxID=2086582 RepID=UPI000D108A7F|nr:phenylacetaldoxime dehydratase family protein [Blastococcus sp. Marseille-P5729]